MRILHYYLQGLRVSVVMTKIYCNVVRETFTCRILLDIDQKRIDMRPELLVKQKTRRVVSRLLSFAIPLILKPLGYGKLGERFHPLPGSSYYQDSRPLNHLIGLHNIPSNKYWLESKKFNQSVKDGELVPWITYPALSYLEKIDFTKLSCVEFGSGASSFWFAARCKDFESFEFDSDYYKLLSKISTREIPNITDSSELLNYFMKADYALDRYQLCIEYDLNHLNIYKTHPNAGSNFTGGDLIIKIREKIANADVVFIDGGPRNFLIALAANHVKSKALLVIDNSDSDYVQLGLQALKSGGFREIPFIGFGSLNPTQWHTSIFIKSLEPLDFLR